MELYYQVRTAAEACTVTSALAYTDPGWTASSKCACSPCSTCGYGIVTTQNLVTDGDDSEENTNTSSSNDALVETPTNNSTDDTSNRASGDNLKNQNSNDNSNSTESASPATWSSAHQRTSASSMSALLAMGLAVLAM